MRVITNGIAKVRDSKTGKVFDIQPDELDWDVVGGEEGPMGSKTHYEAVVEHEDLGTLTWGLWEYPVGAQNHAQTEVGSHTLVEDFDYGLEHEPEPE